MNEISNIQITLKTGPNGECPFCKGKGYFCVKQGPVAINVDGFKIYPSITIGFPWCHGTGKAKDHNRKELYPGEKNNWEQFNRRTHED